MDSNSRFVTIPAVKMLLEKWLGVTSGMFAEARVGRWFYKTRLLLTFGRNPFWSNVVCVFAKYGRPYSSKPSSYDSCSLEIKHFLEDVVGKDKLYHPDFDAKLLDVSEFQNRGCLLSSLPLDAQTKIWRDAVFSGLHEGGKFGCAVCKHREMHVYDGDDGYRIWLSKPGLDGETRMKQLLEEHDIFEEAMIASTLDESNED